MRHLLLARAARQPAAQEIGPERDHRTVRFDREAAPRRRLVAGWHGRPAGVRMSGETAPTAQARAERQEQTARWVDRPRRQRRSRSAAAAIACRPALRPPAGRRHAIRDATPERLARTAHDGTLRCEPIRPGKDDRPYFETRLSEPAKVQFRLPRAMPRMARSAALLDRQMRPSSRKPVNDGQRLSRYAIAFATSALADSFARCSRSHASSAVTSCKAT